jgi:alkylated DNA repair dioxygenase AlkB
LRRSNKRRTRRNNPYNQALPGSNAALGNGGVDSSTRFVPQRYSCGLSSKRAIPHIGGDPAIVEELPGVTTQLELFTSSTAEPAGLCYASDFVGAQTEQELIGQIAALPLKPFQFGQYEGKRRVASFGFSYDYATRRLQEGQPIPGWLTSIISQVESFGGPETHIRQVLCTEYDTGVGIGWHRDRPHFDRVFGLSLGSACKIRFRRAMDQGWQRFTIDAEPRSLYLLSGASRQLWEHSIAAVEAPRYSITFRTMAGDLIDSERYPISRAT